MCAFAKPADFEFPQEKVLWLAEQQVGCDRTNGELSSACNIDLFTYVFSRILSWLRRKQLARVRRWFYMNKLA